MERNTNSSDSSISVDSSNDEDEGAILDDEDDIVAGLRTAHGLQLPSHQSEDGSQEQPVADDDAFFSDPQGFENYDWNVQVFDSVDDTDHIGHPCRGACGKQKSIRH